MSDKKYSVFISSTFDDLKEQRSAVLNVVLQNGHFPLGMELWGAANEQQWQIIQRQIDVADYYVVIIAHRYGTQHKGVSWTEKEYNYAVEKGVPVLGFILDEDTKWEPANIEKGPGAKKLDNFRKKVRKKPVDFWKDTDDLRTKVVLALNRQIQSTPRIGWIRANEGLTSSTANELARLSEENSRLRDELARLAEDDLPTLSFELVEGYFTAHNDDRSHFGVPIWRLEAALALNVTLKKGRPPGFNMPKVALSVQSKDKRLILEPILSDSKGRTLTDLTIDGPMTIRVSGRLKGANIGSEIAAEIVKNDRIEMKLALTPIGYQKQYSLCVGLDYIKHSDPLRWSASQAEPMRFETVPLVE